MGEMGSLTKITQKLKLEKKNRKRLSEDEIENIKIYLHK